MTTEPELAIIGGTGLYQFNGLRNQETLEIRTPFGNPSSPIIVGLIHNRKVAFLARHGIGHILPPTEINNRANIYALKKLGVSRVVSVNACGSLREDLAPGHIIIPDQLFDFTRQRERTFFSTGMVAHISSATPFCPELSKRVNMALVKSNANVHSGGTMITIEGPRFSTKAESKVFRSWGMDVIGMTTCPEAFLAREAGLCYVSVAHITDYDVWHETEEPVDVRMVIRTLEKNTEIIHSAILNLAEILDQPFHCDCHQALEYAIVTQKQSISLQLRKKLAPIIEKHLK